MAASRCKNCGKELVKRNRRFCNRACYAEASRKGLVANDGRFKKGAESPNKGRTLESWVGEERAAEIRARMSRTSKKKVEFLRGLNERKDLLLKRKISRWFHESVVEGMVEQLRSEGWRCYILSEYIKERRTPDAILFDGRELVALEVELQKKWKPSEQSMTRRLSDLNSDCRFFDRTAVVFPKEGSEVSEVVPALLANVRGERLNGV